MIVYAETNFLLEIAYQQEGCESCLEIAELARQNRISLVVPAFSLIEARLNWDRRRAEYNTLRSQLQPIIRQLARSEPFRSVKESSLELLTALVASGEEMRLRLEKAMTSLTSVATILLLNEEITARADQEELNLALSPSDAVIYASIKSHLRGAPAGPKCFLNRDSKGFSNPSLYDELAKLGCKLIVSFERGLGFIRSELRSAAT